MRSILILCGFLFYSVAAVHADLYQWTDEQGVIHVIDDSSAIPEAYRDKVKIHHTAKPTTSPTSLLAPSRTYQENSQGAFAQKLAFDLGLINKPGEDALGPLGAVGIQPAGGWRVSDSLTPEAHMEIIAAARRAADSQRLRMSADGAEAIVRQTALAFLPPPLVQTPTPSTEYYEEEPVYEQPPAVIIERESPRTVEIIPEPVYIPTPVIGGRYHGNRRFDRNFESRSDFESHRGFENPQRRQHKAASPPTLSTPAPTHMPFGASHMPFGASHMPFGTSPTPSGANPRGR